MPLMFVAEYSMQVAWPEGSLFLIGESFGAVSGAVVDAGARGIAELPIGGTEDLPSCTFSFMSFKFCTLDYVGTF
ncbi:hypothetical protein VNO78_02972 [Psophocarpus tetragonolobus]|uniref:Uncharacterized protein n=1 Tax=Psophocarpus tetragonolobus TaxID=3891 RepID=A0AAN9T3H2_PSOTE